MGVVTKWYKPHSASPLSVEALELLQYGGYSLLRQSACSRKTGVEAVIKEHQQ